MGAPRSLRITRRERLRLIALFRQRHENAVRLGQKMPYDAAAADDLQRLDAALYGAKKALEAVPESLRSSPWWTEHGKDALDVCAYYLHDVVRVTR